MRLLVEHGYSNNFGDIAMLEGAVLRLKIMLPKADIFIIEKPKFSSMLWLMDRIQKHEAYGIKPFLWSKIKRIPILKFYNEEWRRICCKLTLRYFETFSTASQITLPQACNPKKITLGKYCEQFDALCLTGGGYLTDIFYGELFRKCLLMLTFAEQNKPIILTGQQLGPFRSEMLKTFLLKALSKTNFVGLRDHGYSLSLCLQAKLGAERYSVMGDDSFGIYAFDESSIEKLIAGYNLKTNEFISFNVRFAKYAFKHSAYIYKIAKIAETLIEKFDMPILIVPIALNDYDSDITSGERLAKAINSDRVSVMNNTAHLTPSLVKGVLGRAFGAVGISYHFCTFSLSMGIPAVCIYADDYYSQKARSLCDFWADQRLAVSLDADTDLAAAHITKVFKDASLKEKLGIKKMQVFEQWQHIFDRQVTDILGAV
jgi:polysaccharide pyruvyl transferase WcaK-like protein